MMKSEYLRTWKRLTDSEKYDPVKDFVLMLILLIVLFSLLVLVLACAYLHKFQIL